MLLRHKKTGNVYAYNKVLWDSGDYEELVEQVQQVPQPTPEKKVIRRRRAALQPHGEQDGANAR
jgi:hypothetical protein